VSLIREMQLNIRLRQDASPLLRPLDQAQAVRAEIITDPHKFQFFRVRKTVKVKVIHPAIWQDIRLNQRISGTFYISLMAKRL